jgi:hypothetical protein
MAPFSITDQCMFGPATSSDQMLPYLKALSRNTPDIATLPRPRQGAHAGRG